MNGNLQLFITVFLGSGASFALLNFASQVWKDRRQRQHVALQIAFHLEAYAIECEKQHSDNSLVNASGGSAGAEITGIPELAPYPSADQLRLLYPQTLNRLYAFPQECLIANRSVQDTFEFVDSDAANEAAADGAIVMASNALQIAQGVRHHYNLEPRRLQFDGWSIEEYFEREQEKIRKRKAEREERSKKSEVPL
jgi:hypothetical protein